MYCTNKQCREFNVYYEIPFQTWCATKIGRQDADGVFRPERQPWELPEDKQLTSK
jgi:hypothetical protein